MKLAVTAEAGSSGIGWAGRLRRTAIGATCAVDSVCREQREHRALATGARWCAL